MLNLMLYSFLKMIVPVCHHFQMLLIPFHLLNFSGIIMRSELCEFDETFRYLQITNNQTQSCAAVIQ